MGAEGAAAPLLDRVKHWKFETQFPYVEFNLLLWIRYWVVVQV